MHNTVKLAFSPEIMSIALDKVMPVRQLPSSSKDSQRYKRIMASIQEVGIIEPLIVFPQEQPIGAYVLLDGHVRLEIAKTLGL